jgi:pantoate--beta-alanine ligase
MDTLHTIEDLRKRLARESRIVLVPTMGNLHDGHAALVETARKRAAAWSPPSS